MSESDHEAPLELGDRAFAPGERGSVELPVGHLITHELVSVTVHVRRGFEPGPTLLLVAALHGDEINGIEIIRRLLRVPMRHLRGNLISVPVANLPAFLTRSRYMPDRRDLNRLFPGSPKGSLGARLACVFSQELIPLATHAIDLHTGALNRPNLPQIRICPGDEEALRLARLFGAPAIIESLLREGSFRECCAREKRTCLMFEGGEAQILDPFPVRTGLRGILGVMRGLGMLRVPRHGRPPRNLVHCRETYWERAPRGGIFAPAVEMGRIVKKGDLLGKVGDPFGPSRSTIRSEHEGIVIGRTKDAVVDEGDGLFHIGATECLDAAAQSIEAVANELNHQLDQPVFDDDLRD